jgi:hypothetical protein
MHMFMQVSIAGTAAVAIAAWASLAQSSARKSSVRTSLAPIWEMIMTVLEAPPGAVLPKHFHHGEEAFYVLKGAMTEVPGQAPSARVPGTGGINVREVPHAGYKVVGDKPLKLLTVHVVDKGKPLAVNVP